MRRALLLSLIILLSLPIASGTNISANTDEGPNGTLSGNYSVTNNATWTLSGDYQVAKDTAIIVEEGAVMEVTGTMDVVSARQLQLASTANVSVPVDFFAESGTMRINFDENYPISHGITIEINDEEYTFGVRPENDTLWYGDTEFDWNGDLDVETLVVNITTNVFQHLPRISSITLSASGEIPVDFEPSDLSGPGTTVVLPIRTWSIDVQGTLIVSGKIVGAEIHCSGTCSLNGAEMLSTGPIEVTGEISVVNSILSGGQQYTDEDIIIWDDASIEWTGSTGTGGDIDNWINVLTTRTVGVQNSNVVLTGFNLGYDNYTTSYLNDCQLNQPEDCDNIIDFNLNERGRMIRWQDGNGDLHVESASASLVMNTPWGIFYENVSNLVKENHFDVEIVLPLLSFDSLVVSDNENAINSRLGVMATITNSGTVDATNVNLDCVSGGEDANIGLVGVTHTIRAGETIEIPMNWDSPTEGELELECSIFVPEDFTGIEVTSKDSAITEKVTWTEEVDDSENMILPISIGIVVAIVIFVIVFRINSKAIKDTSEDEHDFDQELDEETGTIE